MVNFQDISDNIFKYFKALYLFAFWVILHYQKLINCLSLLFQCLTHANAVEICYPQLKPRTKTNISKRPPPLSDWKW